PTPHSGGGAAGSDPKVLTATRGSMYEIILNRPKAINALDSEMVAGIRGAVDQAGRDKRRSLILLRPGEDARGLCSGGDVLKVVNFANGKSDEDKAAALAFFKEEFSLDWVLAKIGEEVSSGESRSARPIVAVMDGITMGGGVGLSVHVPFRIATERTMFAMPETGIGYFPDVGVTRVLSRLDGRVGSYLGTTGDRISGQEAYALGLATHFLPSSSLQRLYDALGSLSPEATAEQVASVLDDFSVDPFDAATASSGKSPLDNSALVGNTRIMLDYVFSHPSMEDVFKSLEDLSKASSVEEVNSSATGRALAKQLKASSLDESLAGDEVRSWAARTLATLKSKSPRSLKVTHQLISYEAKHYSVDDSFRNDMRLATVFCDLSVGRDFYEGVHHILTKDPATNKRREGRAPWKPSNLEGVDNDLARDLFFGSLEDAASKGGLKLTPPELDVIPTRKAQDRSARQSEEEAKRGLGPLGWQAHFNVFHPLPSEAELEALLHGSHPVSGKVVREVADMIRATRRRRGLSCFGVEWKVREWRRR
ncbi:ClpP/crotonase, partial [Microstroma glucosiphilum]